MSVAPALLAIVFAIAALAKWRDGRRLLPAYELVLAAALLAVPSYAAPVALATLAGFTVYLVLALRRRQPCNCFGSANTEPVSSIELVRNAVLLVLAVLALLASRPPWWLDVLVVLAVGALDRRHEGPSVGRPAPTIEGVMWPSLLAFTAPSCGRCDPPPHARVIEDGRAQRAYRVRAVPYYVEVDAAGIVRWRGAELSARHSAR